MFEVISKINSSRKTVYSTRRYTIATIDGSREEFVFLFYNELKDLWYEDYAKDYIPIK